MELSIYLYHPSQKRVLELQKYIAAVLFNADYKSIIRSCTDVSRFEVFLCGHATAIDILFLPADQHGFLLGQKLRQYSRHTTLVFYDGNTEKMPNAFCMLPISYLLRGCDRNLLSKNILLAAMWSVKEKHTFFHETKTDIYNINYNDIDFFESNYRVVNIHFTDGTVKTITAKLNQIQEKLPGEIFCRAHQSYLVNLTHISRIDKTDKSIHFHSGFQAFASKACFSMLIESMKGRVADEIL